MSSLTITPPMSYDGAVIQNISDFEVWNELYNNDAFPVKEVYTAWIEDANPIDGSVELSSGKFIFFEEAVRVNALMYIESALDDLLVEGLDAVGHAVEEDGSLTVILSYGGPSMWLSNTDGAWTAYYHYQGMDNNISCPVENKEIVSMLDNYNPYGL